MLAIISASSSSDPTPPGRTINASDLDINSCFRLSRVSETTISFSLGLANSKACRDFKEIPKTSTPLSIAVSEMIFISPTLPPPKTILMFFLAIYFAIVLADSAYLGFLPL